MPIPLAVDYQRIVMPQVTRRLEFDYGHRVLRHESKCKHLHGHRGVAEVTVSALELDGLGRVIDFGVLKTILGGWVDENLDHNILLNSEDPLLDLDEEEDEEKVLSGLVFGGKKPFEFVGTNPTAENIAAVLYHKAVELLPSPLKVVSVRFYETPNCWADYPG